ncbi:MAG: formylglycine-generating enzyme family protein [Chloroflexota bacterium]
MATDILTLSNSMEFMHVPAGRFLMGSNSDFALHHQEYPQHTVNIPYDYWMGRFLVTNELYHAYTKAIGTKHFIGGRHWRKKKDHPVIYVEWDDARIYCQWLSDLFIGELPSGLVLRLPTEAEWEKSARGEFGNVWPWGNEFDKNKCNTYEGGKGDTTPVDMYSPQGDSPYGCADMVGNVWEWTQNTLRSYPYRANDGLEYEDENGSDDRVLRGGSYANAQDMTDCCFRHLLGGAIYLHNVGFRVVCSLPLPPSKDNHGWKELYKQGNDGVWVVNGWKTDERMTERGGCHFGVGEAVRAAGCGFRRASLRD